MIGLCFALIWNEQGILCHRRPTQMSLHGVTRQAGQSPLPLQWSEGESMWDLAMANFTVLALRLVLMRGASQQAGLFGLALLL